MWAAGGRDEVQPLCRAHHQNYLDQVQEGPEIVKNYDYHDVI